MPFLGIYSWSQYTTPTGIPSGDLTGDTTPNDPAAPGYSSSAPTWIGETFTFNGGAPTQIDISDRRWAQADIRRLQSGSGCVCGLAMAAMRTKLPSNRNGVIDKFFSLKLDICLIVF